MFGRHFRSRGAYLSTFALSLQLPLVYSEWQNQGLYNRTL